MGDDDDDEMVGSINFMEKQKMEMTFNFIYGFLCNLNRSAF